MHSVLVKSLTQQMNPLHFVVVMTHLSSVSWYGLPKFSQKPFWHFILFCENLFRKKYFFFFIYHSLKHKSATHKWQRELCISILFELHSQLKDYNFSRHMSWKWKMMCVLCLSKSIVHILWCRCLPKCKKAFPFQVVHESYVA